MKKLMLGQPTGAQDIGWAHRALKTIERASYEDVEALVDDYEVTGEINEVRSIDAAESDPLVLRDFLLTFITDLQRRGQNRGET